MLQSIICQIEAIPYNELLSYMQHQASDSFPALLDEKKLLAFVMKLDSHAEFCLCRNDQGKAVGMVAFYANGQGADFAYITHAYVSPEYRRQGCFRRMLTTISSVARERGFHEIKLEVARDNIGALQSYLKNGFMIDQPSASGNSLFLKLAL